MRRVRGKDTTPEMAVRSLLHRLGFRFRLHRKDLPGKPDIVLPKHKAAIFVHGCFWHRHAGCSRASTPATRQEYWLPKFRRTVERDKRNQDKLRRAGWNVIVVWECEIRDMDRLSMLLPNRITRFPAIYPEENRTALAAAEEGAEYDSHPRQRK
jgi:DNA mismatch endonuclease (patch repair protein)